MPNISTNCRSHDEAGHPQPCRDNAATRAGYLRTCLACLDFDLPCGAHAIAWDGTTFMSDHPTQSQVKIGVNYRFVPGAAVIAKY